MVKLSLGASDGKTVIVKIAQQGEVLGRSATLSGKPHALAAETIVQHGGEQKEIVTVHRGDLNIWITSQSAVQVHGCV
jgi:hypothetical protein